MTLATMQWAYTMLHVYPVISFCSLHRTEVGCKHNGIALRRIQDLRLRLSTRQLFHENQLTSPIIGSSPGKHDDDLERKVNLAVKILE